MAETVGALRAAAALAALLALAAVADLRRAATRRVVPPLDDPGPCASGARLRPGA